jgi:hypothetical protein
MILACEWIRTLAGHNEEVAEQQAHCTSMVVWRAAETEVFVPHLEQNLPEDLVW